jgi:TonB family protein
VRRSVSLGVLFAGIVSCPSVDAQESLRTAQALYASAAYEDALGVLGRLRAVDPTPEVEVYRAFCLVALDRSTDAEAIIRAMVEAHPAFVPDAGEMPRRVQDIFARARKDLLPDIVRRAYLEAKSALDRKDREVAQRRFNDLILLVDGVGPDADEALREYRLLSAGFLDLTRAVSAPAAADAPPTPRSPAPAVPSQIIPPVAIRQSMPQWIPTDAASRLASFSGSVRVSITSDGRVDRVGIDKSVHPAYDPLLLRAAQAWEYLPARRDGVAVPSEQVVHVQLKPHQ